MPQTRDVLKCCVRISPQILTTDPHPHPPLPAHNLPAAAVCPIHLSLASWVTEEQLTAAAAEHGHGMTQIEHIWQHYTIASAHCAQQVSLPSAELELMIRVSPRLASANFRGRAVRVSPRISRILADLRLQADASVVRTSLPQTAVAVAVVRRVARRHRDN